MKQQSKFSPHQQHEQDAELHAAKKTGLEFDSVEQLLRHDAAQTAVPQGIARRLGESIEKPGVPTRSWWRRLLE
jgi:hypothetical protein